MSLVFSGVDVLSNHFEYGKFSFSGRENSIFRYEYLVINLLKLLVTKLLVIPFLNRSLIPHSYNGCRIALNVCLFAAAADYHGKCSNSTSTQSCENFIDASKPLNNVKMNVLADSC